MALIVQKYGGTSVGSIDRIRSVADRIIQTQKAGHAMVVVVSAMAGETDHLLALAHSLNPDPDPRELAVLLSTGEQRSIALLSLALLEQGCPARSYTGTQVPIYTDSVYNKANILAIDESRIRADLSLGLVVVVAGFQGIDQNGHITTLGRGGSDTTAVALAAALKADECQIYTDVAGIHTIDPRFVPKAALMAEIDIRQMLEMASTGAKVMQNRALSLAAQHRVPLRVLSSFEEGDGTVIIETDRSEQAVVVSGLAFSRDEARFLIQGIEARSGLMADLLDALSAAHIEIDMIVQSESNLETGYQDVAFTVHQRERPMVLSIIENFMMSGAIRRFCINDQMAKLAIIGIGLRSDLQNLSTV
jgi:aspartate kinase